MEYNFVIAGAGLSGSVYARIMAERGFKILVLERRPVVSGNLYDQRDENGIIVQKYGPHIFHTNNDEVYNFITKFAKWDPFKLQCEVQMCGQSTPSPFNFKTIDQFYSDSEAKELKDLLISTYPGRETVTIVELLDSPNESIKKYAQFLFDNDYSLYTAKQWGCRPEEIDVSVLRRVPVRLDYRSMYFTDKYECMPVNGFADFVTNILKHDNIDVITNVNALDYISVGNDEIRFKNVQVASGCKFVYTGAIDELFGYQLGELPYRSLRFEYKTVNVDSYQNAPVVAYPQVPDYTRITEYKKLPVQNKRNVSTIALEYPVTYSAKLDVDPYYPIPTEDSNRLYSLYKNKADLISNLILCGRLAEYKYYNMDQAIASVLNKLII